MDRQEQIAALFQRRSALTKDEEELFASIYDDFYDEHYDKVVEVLRHRGLRGATLDDQAQETFVSFFFFVVGEGFPDDIPAKLCSIAVGHALNGKRAKKRERVSAGAPSSRSEPAKSTLRGLERRLDLHRIGKVLPMLSAEHQAVVQAIFFDDKTQEKAADDLGISRGALCRQLEAAKRRLAELLAFVPESQRGTP